MYTKIMYIGAKQKRQFLIFTVGFFVLIFVVSLLVILNNRGNFAPRDVVLSNVREDGVTVTWITDIKARGSLILYENGERVGKFKDSRNFGGSYTHYVEITDLKPNTLYEFEIVSAEEEKFEFSTREVLSEIPTPNILRGTLDTSDTLVFLLVDDLTLTYPLSTYVEDSNEWSFNLANLTLVSGRGIFDFRSDTPLKLLFYNNDGVKVIQGNRNALFDRGGVFNNSVELDSSENIFSYIPDFAKFKGIPVEMENIANETENDVVPDDVLGVEDEEEVEKEERKIENDGNLQRLESPSDYGLY
jgi:hypothetical protein